MVCLKALPFLDFLIETINYTRSFQGNYPNHKGIFRALHYEMVYKSFTLEEMSNRES